MATVAQYSAALDEQSAAAPARRLRPTRATRLTGYAIHLATVVLVVVAATHH